MTEQFAFAADVWVAINRTMSVTLFWHRVNSPLDPCAVHLHRANKINKNLNFLSVESKSMFLTSRNVRVRRSLWQRMSSHLVTVWKICQKSASDNKHCRKRHCCFNHIQMIIRGLILFLRIISHVRFAFYRSQVWFQSKGNQWLIKT